MGSEIRKIRIHFMGMSLCLKMEAAMVDCSDHGKHNLMGEMNGVGDKVNLNSFHGHEFVFKDESGHGRSLHKVAVDKDQGVRQYLKITDIEWSQLQYPPKSSNTSNCISYALSQNQLCTYDNLLASFVWLLC